MRGRKVAEQIHSAARNNNRVLGKQRNKGEGRVEEPGEGKTILHAERVHGGGEISAAPSQILFNSFLDIQLT